MNIKNIQGLIQVIVSANFTVLGNNYGIILTANPPIAAYVSLQNGAVHTQTEHIEATLNQSARSHT